jgi:hypothetical protein
MAQTWKQVNWFRFFVIVSLSFLTSMIFNLDDSALNFVEIFRTTIQALIAGFAFLQCPETKKPEMKL